MNAHNSTPPKQKIAFLLRFFYTSLATLIIILAPNFSNLLGIDLNALKTWWLLMFSASLLIIAASHSTIWQKSGFFAALLLLSFSSQLSITEPKWFQQIALETSTKFNWLCLLVLIVQFIACISILIREKTHKQLSRHIATLGRGKLTIFIGMSLAISISAMPHIGNKDTLSLIKQLLYSATFLFINLSNLIVLAITLPNKPLQNHVNRALEKISLFGPTKQTRQFDTLLPYIVSAWVFIASAFICTYAFERLPHVEDEVAYLFQAKHLLKGMLTLPASVMPEAFEFYLLQVVDERWFSMTPPAWSLFLALGSSLDATWLVNPFLAAASILLAHALLVRVYNRTIANTTILLMAISPWFLALSASMMNHTVTLTFMMATWLCFYQAKKNQSISFALTAGLCAGVIFLTRQLDGLIIGILTGLWSLQMVSRPKGLSLITGYAIGCIIIGGLIFPYNWHITGDPLLSTANYYINDHWYPGANRLGFGPDIGPPTLWGKLDLYKGHSFFESIVHLQHNSYMLNFDLFGWGIGSLCLVFIHMIWGTWHVFEKYMLAIVIILIVAYSLYWFSGSFYIGPRYWFVVFFPLTVISAAGINTLINVFTPHDNNSLVISKVVTIFIVLSIITIISFTPWRSTTRYYEFRNYHSDFRNMVNDNDLQNSIIFISNASEMDFGSAFILSDPTFTSSAPIFAYDKGHKNNISLAKHFPERNIYYAQGRGKEGMKAKLIRGPLTLESFHEKN